MKQFFDLANFCCTTFVKIIDIVPAIIQAAPKMPKKSTSTSKNIYCKTNEKNTPDVFNLKNLKEFKK